MALSVIVLAAFAVLCSMTAPVQGQSGMMGGGTLVSGSGSESDDSMVPFPSSVSPSQTQFSTALSVFPISVTDIMSSGDTILSMEPTMLPFPSTTLTTTSSMVITTTLTTSSYIPIRTKVPLPSATLTTSSMFIELRDTLMPIESTQTQVIFTSPVSSTAVPSTPQPPAFVIQLSFNATIQEFNTSIRDTLIAILQNVTESSVEPIVMVNEELSMQDIVVTMVYFESSDTESRELTRQAFITLMGSNNTAWVLLRMQYSVMVDLLVESIDNPTTNPPSISPPTEIVLTLWQWIIVAVGGTLIILIILVMLLCCCQALAQRSKKQPKGYEHHRLIESDLPTQRNVPKPSLELNSFPVSPRKVSRISPRPKGMLQQLSHPLTPEELEPLADNTAALYSEYATIPSNMVSMAEVPPGAEEKNRYRDVLPNPYTRVSLFLKFGVANSDYINANYIRGYKDSSKSYVATQGPLQWTVADFWRMVWEQKVSTIIMVTALEERGMNKCARYWPGETTNHCGTYEDLEVRLKRRLTASNKDYITTTFHLAHKQKMVSREVTHFWFTGWPDHGVPMSAKSVIEFLIHARGYIREMPGPTVVHCSAGIGRTGVFIGAEIGMQQLEEEGEVDILKIVSTLRQDKGGMVQTRDQYVFLHKIMLEYAHYLSQVQVHHRRRNRGGFGGQGSFTYLQPTIQEETSDNLALLT